MQKPGSSRPPFRFDSVRRRLTAHPRLLVSSVVLVALVAWAFGGWVAWLTFDIPRGLPDRNAVRDIGDMVQATTLYDAHDRPVFAIFKEQRIEIPLSKVSRNLLRAVVAVEDQRFFEHRGVDAVRILGA